MKILVLISLLMLTPGKVPDSERLRGIEFFKGSFDDAMAESRKTGKPIFMDIYASWCGPCKQLKRTTFRDKEVALYFNANFINMTINGETAEGSRVRNIYNVKSYPTLLIVDGNGRQLAKTSGFMKPYILINFGRRVIPDYPR